MCGILGFIGDTHSQFVDKKNILSSLKRRGPDASGDWTYGQDFLYFGHTRLSVLDLTDNGNQPMVSSNGRFIVTYNGEIYNFNYLKKNIENNTNLKIWKSNSDTEVLCESIQLYGLEKTLNMCDGMFAMGVFDKKKNELFLARDQFGEKPLYYGYIKNNFFFSSDLNFIKSINSNYLKINKKSVYLLAKYSYIPSPYTIYEDVYKLEPSHFLKLNINNFKNLNSKKKFTTLNWLNKDNENSKIILNTSFDQYCNNLEEQIEESVKSRMISDVSLGSFLSGGIDSSLITALMQKNSANKVETFSIGQSDNRFNESIYAKEVSKKLGTNHNEYIVGKKEIIDTIEKINTVYSEPFADSSQIPSIILSEHVRKKVTVALTGDGGDELFGGYNRYIYSNFVLKIIKHLPYTFRKYFSLIGKSISPSQYNKLLFFLNYRSNFISNPGDKLHKIFDKLELVKNERDLYLSLITEWDNGTELFDNANSNHYDCVEMFCRKLDFTDNAIQKMMIADVKYYLPDDILTKVDRAAMYSSLETRVPFLNRNIYNIVKNMPLEFKINKNKGKIVLRKILKKYLPINLIDRPKMGFAIPMDNYLRNDLKEWASDLINSGNIYSDYFDKKILETYWKEHLSKKRNWQSKLWPILSFISWSIHK